jgi:hypothetical protein
MQRRQAGGDISEVVAVGKTVQRGLDRLMSVDVGRAAPSHADTRYASRRGGVTVAITSGKVRE